MRKNKRKTTLLVKKAIIVDDGKVYRRLEYLFDVIYKFRRMVIEERRRVQALSDRVMDISEQLRSYYDVRNHAPLDQIPYDTAINIIKEIGVKHKKNGVVPNLGDPDKIAVPFYCNVSYKCDEINIPSVGICKLMSKGYPKYCRNVDKVIIKKRRDLWVAEIVMRKHG